MLFNNLDIIFAKFEIVYSTPLPTFITDDLFINLNNFLSFLIFFISINPIADAKSSTCMTSRFGFPVPQISIDLLYSFLFCITFFIKAGKK